MGMTNRKEKTNETGSGCRVDETADSDLRKAKVSNTIYNAGCVLYVQTTMLAWAIFMGNGRNESCVSVASRLSLGSRK